VRPSENLPESLKSIQVVVRFMLRIVILLAFALLGGTSFAQNMVALLWMSALLCAVVATMRRELPFRTDLNHWDEMTTYLALCCLASRFALPVPA
jgi:hypothetical protein